MQPVIVRLFKRRRVPREFLKPRPMSGGPRPRHALLGYLSVEILAVALCVCVTLLAPLQAMDERWMELALTRASRASPPQTVAVLRVTPAHSKTSTCGRDVAQQLTRGGALAGLVLSPLAELCDGAFDSSALDSEMAPPVQAFPSDVLRRGSHGAIVGLTTGVAEHPLLSALGFSPRRWIASRAVESVPVLDLDAMLSGDTEAALLARRIVILSLLDRSPGARSGPSRVAALLAAAREDPPTRKPAWPWLGLVALCFGVGLAGVQRSARGSRQARYGLTFSGVFISVVAASSLLGPKLLMPLPSLFGAFSLTYVVLLLPRRAAALRAGRDARRVLERAGRLLSIRSPSANDEGEFWRRLARTAAQTHPADDVLVAELPAFSWRLKVWPNGETDESVIRERRRDVRRTPYANLQGVPVSSVVQDYLVMRGTPAVLVPLVAANEVEGYLILIGKRAAEEFVTRPALSAGLAKDLGRMIREARVQRMQDEAWRRPAGMRDVPVEGDRAVLERARAAMAELRLLNALVQNAPVGLFYADSFGDVRILGRPVARWLPEFGIDLPASQEDGSVDAGVLSLKQLLHGFTRKTGTEPPPLTEIDGTGYSLDVPAPPRPGQRVKSLRLKVVALGRGGSEPTGFVGSVTESAIMSASMAPRPSIMRQTVESLQVFSLSQLLKTVVADVANGTEGKVNLQAPRDEAHVVAHRADFELALSAFLLEAARLAGKTRGPVLVVRERRMRVELRIMDLRLDAPAPALERTLMAPSNPPVGLDALGGLIQAVENSHGDVRLRSKDSWGAVVYVSLVRARPRLAEPPPVPNLRLYDKPVRLG